MVASARELLQLPGLQGLQNVHPLIVHYPVAFLTGAVFLYFLAWISHRESWAWIGLGMLGLGTVGAAVAVWSGLDAGAGVMIAPSVREHILVHHEHYMLVGFALSVILTAWALWTRPIPRRGRIGFMLLLLLMAVVLAKGADFGAWMVYGYNAGGSLPQPIDFSK
jgi:uncharacterized membrane protein